MDLSQINLGSAIKNARLGKNLTQEKLAEFINITPMHLKQLESGRRNPSFEVLCKLVFALDLSLDSVFSPSDDETQELRSKINIRLNRCDEYELSVVYAMMGALVKKQ